LSKNIDLTIVVSKRIMGEMDTDNGKKNALHFRGELKG